MLCHVHLLQHNLSMQAQSCSTLMPLSSAMHTQRGLSQLSNGTRGFSLRLLASPLSGVGLVQVEHAVADGCDVRGLLYWTLMDNFEWAFGWAPRFGLFEWNVTEPNQVRPSLPPTKASSKAVSCTAHM